MKIKYKKCFKKIIILRILANLLCNLIILLENDILKIMDWSFNNLDLKLIENHWIFIKRNMELYGLEKISKLKSFYMKDKKKKIQNSLLIDFVNLILWHCKKDIEKTGK